MIGAQERSALSALAAARPAITALDRSRHHEENAADIIEAWTAVETALRALAGGSMLSGQSLIGALRHQNLIPIDTAHALLDFLAVRQRVDRADYQPSEADLAAARSGYRKLEEALTETREMGAVAEPDAGTPDLPPAYLPPPEPPHRQPWIVLLAVLAALFLGAAAAAYFFGPAVRSGVVDLTSLASPFRRRVPPEVRRGQEAYAAGQRDSARAAFTLAARRHTKLALPHIYLGRLAREDGDWATAGRELAVAVRLEPNSALAHRELGSFFLARGQYEAARRAYVRALEANPIDTTAQGYLGCALLQLGRTEEGQRWIDRAGRGSWTACATAPDRTNAPRPPPP